MNLDKDLPYTEVAFNALERTLKGEVVGRANDIEAIVLTWLRLLTEVRQRFAALDADKWLDSREDITAQLLYLLSGPFLRDTPAEWLAQYPRYMKALLQRIERLAGQYPKDQQYTETLRALAQPLQEVQEERPGLLLLSAEARAYRWMLEEFRVSLFAQNLGTRQAVSQKRLAEQWQAASQWLEKNPH
jgi:ATP-dependent helicase HrpA